MGPCASTAGGIPAEFPGAGMLEEDLLQQEKKINDQVEGGWAGNRMYEGLVVEEIY